MTETDVKKAARLFFALWPDDEGRAAMESWQPPLQQLCGGRPTPADKLHNTLVFLGEVEFGRLEALQLAAQEVNGSAFQLSFDTARYWGHNHIVYAAPAIEPAKLMQLVGDLEQRLRHHRFKFDQRPYKPHVTLMRRAQWSDRPLPAMQQLLWEMRDFALVQSASDGQGGNYEVLARFPLKVT